MLIIGAALARPMLGGGGALGPRGPRTIYLVIDNSLASAVNSGSGTELMVIKKKHAKPSPTSTPPAAIGSPLSRWVRPPSR